MIKVSTRGRYALRALIDLALQSDEEPVSRQSIAERQAISADYVAQLFRQLQRAGLVEGIKGPGGGYRLARNAATITTLEVVQAVEGPVALVDCVDPEADASCSRVDRCTTRPLWRQLSTVMTDFLASITLQDLCNEVLEPQQVRE